MDPVHQLKQKFRQAFGRNPELIVSAPGRVNLIGEHTDYNEGFVLPMAIERRLWVAGRKRNDQRVRLRSLNRKKATTFSLPELQREGHWADYPKGVMDQLRQRGFPLQGFEALFYGDIPVGAGLSSSAALEVASSFLLEKLLGFSLEPVERAKLCQRAENEFVGTRCGIMDQLISCLGQKDHALFIDCRSLDYRSVPFALEGYRVAICNSKVQRGLVDSEYNARRRECEEGVRLLAEKLPNIRALRDVSFEQLDTHRSALPEKVYRRSRHVITENDRVLKAVAALERGDLRNFGEYLNQSHESLRADYEVSCRELDILVELARSVEGVLGSRLTGAGFGGCTISLVPENRFEEFREKILQGYAEGTGLIAEIYTSQAEDGVRLERSISS